MPTPTSLLKRLRPAILLACLGSPILAEAPQPAGYATLLSLFQDWRVFQRPRLVDGVPDYRPTAMAKQQQDLALFRLRLKALDTKGWSIPELVDYQIIRAEMAGLDFDHRVLKPWANNPAFYATVLGEQSDQPAPEGPFAAGMVDLWRCTFPLSPSQAAALQPGLRAIPSLLAQARTNLVGDGRDLWTWGAKSLEAQAHALTQFEARLDGPALAELRQQVGQARAATVSFAGWVAEGAKQKTGPSGIGVANYDWYLKHVQLLPHGWRDEVTLLERELVRAKALLAIEEHRNRALPELQPIANAEAHAKAFAAAVPKYMAFLRGQDLMTLPDYFGPALLSKVGSFDPGPRAFFTEVDYRDPLVLRTHGYHWFDLAWMDHAPHPSPIRRGALLYNIFDTRTEGHATGWEEMMLQAGLFDDRPRSRELVYILLAQRAARGLASLRLHSGEFTLAQAAAFAATQTPRGWLRIDHDLVWWEQHLYLQQPGYGTSYITGKIELEKLLTERRELLGDRFQFKAYMDAFNAAGLIPASLLRWELTGRMPEDVRKMLAEE